MGHDITLYDECGNQLYYVRYGAFLPVHRHPRHVYVLFDAMSHNGGLSGYGDSVDFTRSEIQNLYNRWKTSPVEEKVQPYEEKMKPPMNDQSSYFVQLVADRRAAWEKENAIEQTEGEAMLCAAFQYFQTNPSAQKVTVEFA